MGVSVDEEDTAPHLPQAARPVAPPQVDSPRPRVRHILRRSGAEALTSATVLAALAVFFVPPLAFLLAGSWAIVTYIRTIWSSWILLTHWQLGAFFARLSALDLAGRVGAVSGGYFALLFSLIVLFAGLLGRRWRRLFAMPGLLLTIPSTLFFGFSLQLSFPVIASRFAAPAALRLPVTLYVLCDVVLLAVLLVDLRPPARSARRIMRKGRSQSMRPAPLVPVRFGVSNALLTDQQRSHEPSAEPNADASVPPMPPLAAAPVEAASTQPIVLVENQPAAEGGPTPLVPPSQ